MRNQLLGFISIISISMISSPVLAKTFTLKLSARCIPVPDNECTTTSSPIVDNGIIYARGFDKYIYAINQMTGKIIKKYNTDSPELLSYSTPVIKDGLLYASALQVYAFDKQKTSIKWKALDFVDTTPVIYNDSIIVGERGGVVAINRVSGKIKWQFQSTDPVYFASPLIFNGHVFTGSNSPNPLMGSTAFYSLNAETGKVDWIVDFLGTDYYATPCAIKNTIYLGNRLHNFYALDAKTREVKWYYPDNITTSMHFVTSPYCDSDKVYVTNYDSWSPPKLFAFDSDSGQVIWSFVPENTSSSDTLSAPTVSQGVVFFGSDNFYLYALDKNTGALKWKFKADAPIRSKPTIANGIVYFTTLEGTLYAIDELSGLIE